MQDIRLKQPQINSTFETIRDYVFSVGGAFFVAIGIIVILNFIWMGLPINFQTFIFRRENDSTAEMVQHLLVRIALSSILALIFMSIYALHIKRLRQERAKAVLNHLTTAVTLRLPIGNYLESAALSEDRNVSRRLLALSRLVQHGVPLGSAFYTSNPELDLRIPSMIDAAERTGQLDRVLHQIAGSLEKESETKLSSSTFAHLLITLAFTSVVIGLILIFVFPKFNQIMRDFNVPPPAAMMFFQSRWWELIMLLSLPLMLILFFMIASISRRIITSRQEINWYSRIADHLKWKLPLVSRMYRDQTYADFANILAGAIESGHTMIDALKACNRVEVNHVFRLKVVNMIICQMDGQSVVDAANFAGMPQLIVAMLKSPDRDQLASGLRFAAQTYQSRHSRWNVTLQAVLPVLFTAILGAIVGMVAMVIFLPLTALIEATVHSIKIGI